MATQDAPLVPVSNSLVPTPMGDFVVGSVSSLVDAYKSLPPIHYMAQMAPRSAQDAMINMGAIATGAVFGRHMGTTAAAVGAAMFPGMNLPRTARYYHSMGTYAATLVGRMLGLSPSPLLLPSPTSNNPQEKQSGITQGDWIDYESFKRRARMSGYAYLKSRMRMIDNPTNFGFEKKTTRRKGRKKKR